MMPHSPTTLQGALGNHASEVPGVAGPAGDGPSEITQTAASEDGDDEEPGFLDMLAEAEEALPLLARVAEEITGVLDSLPALTDEMMRSMAESDARGGGAGGRLRVAKEFADRLEEPTTDLEQLAADFVGELGRMAPGFSYLIAQIEQDRSILDKEEGARQFADAIEQLAKAAKESLAQIDGLADIVGQLGKVSTRLRPVSRRMSTALRRISSSSRTIEDWGRRMESTDHSG